MIITSELISRRFWEMVTNSGLTLAQLSRLSGVPPTTFQHYKNGHLPGAFNLALICKVCDTSTDWVLGLKEEK